MIKQCPRVIRSEIRAGRFCGPTSGLAAGYVQANIAIVPAEYADEFALFCEQNNRACALLYRAEPGQFLMSGLGQDIDIRSDVPRYLVHRAGQAEEEITDISALWREDLVTFALGCSFSFEEALIAAGLEVRNIVEGRNVPMYRTDRECTAVGRFHGKLVVSMRPFNGDATERACEISGHYPLVHGAPIFSGDAAALGINELHEPDFGDAVRVDEEEVPLFWACGVTAIEALRNANLPFCITHAPGHMLIADRLNAELELVTDIQSLDWH
ncbi:putative hydro-lyase [Microbulbifer agarilyticus]|uniref:putative hydro-lyase n=1 Tax=Microbulbifer agarilyticus TaxID=260552 RepID=UPI001C95DA15|nr:putative hydro-lyase [Microbulbifer agarilyticus]MBY6188959.1 putative hydro-lyase [Microbulbifer agarilyticus]